MEKRNFTEDLCRPRKNVAHGRLSSLEAHGDFKYLRTEAVKRKRTIKNEPSGNSDDTRKKECRKTGKLVRTLDNSSEC